MPPCRKCAPHCRRSQICQVPRPQCLFSAIMPTSCRFISATPLDFSVVFCYTVMVSSRGVAQLVARLLWEQDAAGSNPVTPTIKERRPSRAPLFYLRRDGRFEAAEKRSFSKRRRRGRSRILSLRPKRPNAERILRFRSFHAISGALPPHFVSRDLMIKFNP